MIVTTGDLTAFAAVGGGGHHEPPRLKRRRWADRGATISSLVESLWDMCGGATSPVLAFRAYLESGEAGPVSNGGHY